MDMESLKKMTLEELMETMMQEGKGEAEVVEVVKSLMSEVKDEMMKKGNPVKPEPKQAEEMEAGYNEK